MSENSTIVTHSLSDVLARQSRGEGLTRPDAPEAAALGADFWDSAQVVAPRRKTSIHLRLDSDVLAWFKARGKGHLTHMNAVLRSYVEANQEN